GARGGARTAGRRVAGDVAGALRSQRRERPGTPSARRRVRRTRTWWCPEPDLNRHAREGAARFKLAVSAFHHPGRPWAPLRACRAYRSASRELRGGGPMLSYFIDV